LESLDSPNALKPAAKAVLSVRCGRDSGRNGAGSGLLPVCSLLAFADMLLLLLADYVE
jgi:hypothetical protein